MRSAVLEAARRANLEAEENIFLESVVSFVFGLNQFQSSKCIGSDFVDGFDGVGKGNGWVRWI